MDTIRHISDTHVHHVWEYAHVPFGTTGMCLEDVLTGTMHAQGYIGHFPIIMPMDVSNMPIGVHGYYSSRDMFRYVHKLSRVSRYSASKTHHQSTSFHGLLIENLPNSSILELCVGLCGLGS